MSNRLALCNTVLSGPRPVDLSTGFSILPGRPEAIEKSIGSAAFLSACEGHNTRSQAVGSGPFINRYSVEFDGVDDRIEIPTITEFNAPSAFSTSHWFKYSGNPTITTHVSMSAGTSGSDRFYVELTSSTNIRYGNGNTFDDITISSVSASNWYNLVTVQNGTSLDVYLNGTKQGGTRTVNAPSSGYGSNFLIGAYGAGGSIGYEWQGLLDEVATWDSALSASDVTSIYNNGTPNDISSLEPVGWWRMGDSNSGVGTTVTDVGSGGNDGTLLNGAEFIDKTVLRKPEDATVVYNYPETSDIPIKPIDLSVSLSDEGAGLIDPTDLQVLLYPPNLRISIQDTEENILARTGDTAGTMAFGTDTNNLYIANTEGFDSWSSIEDN